MTRRFLFSSIAASGHFHPLVPLARALKVAGHEVAFAGTAALRPSVEAAGFDCLLVGGDMAADPEYQQVKAQIQSMTMNLATELFSYPRLFAGIPSRVRTPNLVAIMQRWQPDMVIREASEYTAVIAAEHLGLPHATVAFAANLKGMALFEREVAAQLAPTRQWWSLPPDPDLSAVYRYLHLSYSPPSFATQDVGEPGAVTSVPATTHYIRPEIFDNGSNESLPNWVAQLPAQPTVYITMGTQVNDDPDFYPNVLQTIIAGLRGLPLNLIVTLVQTQGR